MERRTRSTNKARAVEWIPDGWSAEKFHADAAARLAGVRIVVYGGGRTPSQDVVDADDGVVHVTFDDGAHVQGRIQIQNFISRAAPRPL